MIPRMPAELRVLREMFHRGDPLPDRMLDAAYAAAGRRHGFDRHTGLELIGDSAQDPGRTRSDSAGPDTRVLTYLMPGRIVEVDLVPLHEDVFRASGIVLDHLRDGPAQGEVLLRSADEQHAIGLDEMGRFGTADVTAGPLSVIFHPAGEPAPAVADWLVC